MNIGMIGMGFVGGTTAKVLSKAHRIFPYDRYKPPYNKQENIDALVKHAEVAFVCVPTPMKKSGEIDYEPMHHSLTVLRETSARLKRDPQSLLVAIRSTAVSGTTDSFATQYPFRFAFNPEFLRERHAEEDMRSTRYIVLGVEDPESERQLRAVYQPIFPQAKVIVTNRRTAEMAKYANNARLATMVTFDNQMYRVCKELGIKYEDIQAILREDPRNGRVMDVPGPDGDFGFGGKCFPKDVRALSYLAREHGTPMHLLEEVWRSNLEVRTNHDWEQIPGATSENKDYNK